MWRLKESKFIPLFIIRIDYLSIPIQLHHIFMSKISSGIWFSFRFVRSKSCPEKLSSINSYENILQTGNHFSGTWVKIKYSSVGMKCFCLTTAKRFELHSILNYTKSESGTYFFLHTLVKLFPKHLWGGEGCLESFTRINRGILIDRYRPGKSFKLSSSGKFTALQCLQNRLCRDNGWHDESLKS